MFFGSIVNKLGASVRRALSQYAVGANEPELALNFIDNEYITNNSTSTFASAITHARSGNATMTDGYGDELVVNGDFLSNIDDWSVSNGTASWVGGQLLLNETGSDGVTARAYQTITTVVGTTYWVTARVGDVSTGTGIVAASNSTSIGGKPQQNSSGNETVSFAFVAEATTTYIVLAVSGTTARTVYFDNVSVKEMPVLKWAPHNLLTYSEQFDNAAWTKNTSATVTANQVVAPDGTTTADEVNFPTAGSSNIQQTVSGLNTTNTYVFAVWLKVASGTMDVRIGNVNSGAYSAVTITNDWQLFTVEQTPSATSRFPRILAASGVTGTFYAWGAHLYRSDLGGMVDNPDQPLSRASYVPTTSSAKYCPRIGHHVFNGSAWSNAGLLAESEARTNLIEHSNELDGTSWTDAGLTSVTADAVGPDGVSNSAYTLTTDTSTGSHHINNNTSVTAGNTYTGSIYVKKGTQRYVRIGAGSAGVWGARVIFDLDNGAVDTVDNGSGIIKEVGNNWYRCSVTGDASSTTSTGFLIQILDASKNVTYTGAGTETVVLYGAQVEIGFTPSSLVPTSGSSATRAAESFTIPSANLPWPEPNYIGSELVTNGTFDTDTSNWTGYGDSTLSVVSGELNVTNNSTGYGYASQSVTTEVGKLYEFTFDFNHLGTTGHFRLGTSLGADDITSSNLFSDQSVEHIFVATTTTVYIRVGNQANTAGHDAQYDNISVREINPLSVSIAMDGRMTYADTGAVTEASFVNWVVDSNNEIRIALQTFSTDVGQINFLQDESGYTQVEVASAIDALSPDIFVPFDIASRHGSTFINGAIDGVALTANTTPTALPDLSATDLNLAYDYMGTVGTFRIWDRDITDDGLVEATNPSLEPSLSLTFEGTGTNSFVVNDWSE
jgi:hypothetical protein